MKTGKIDLQPLRDLASSGFDKFARAHPESAQAASLLKQATLSIFAADNADFETIDRFFPVMNARADELEVDVFLYAYTQELIDEMSELARKALKTRSPDKTH